MDRKSKGGRKREERDKRHRERKRVKGSRIERSWTEKRGKSSINGVFFLHLRISFMKGCLSISASLHRLQRPYWTPLSVSSHLIHGRSMAAPSCGGRRKWTVHPTPNLTLFFFPFLLVRLLCLFSSLFSSSLITAPTPLSTVPDCHVYHRPYVPIEFHFKILFFAYPQCSMQPQPAFSSFLSPALSTYHRLLSSSSVHSFTLSLDFRQDTWHYISLFHSSPSHLLSALQTSQETPAWRSAIIIFTFPFWQRGFVALWYARDGAGEPNAESGATVNGDHLKKNKNEEEKIRRKSSVKWSRVLENIFFERKKKRIKW